MTRTFLAVAAASAAAMCLFASAAEACISCEYVPEVVRNHTTSSEPRSYSRSRSYEAVEQRRTRKSRVVCSAIGDSPAPVTDTSDSGKTSAPAPMRRPLVG